MKEKKPLVILTGPTAVGKTALSILLAKTIGGEIISADSMQVYQHMNIGSAKIRPEEMCGIPHYLIDCVSPLQEFNVVLFQSMAKSAMKSIWKNEKIPILVGGTGFYIQSVLYDIDFTETEEDSHYREALERIGEEQGNEALHHMLEQADKKAALRIHPNNRKRVIRALEFYEKTGKKISEHNEAEMQKESPYAYCYFVLNDDRKKIYENIDNRVTDMMKAGLLEEVKKLQQLGCKRESSAMQGLGYKELFDYLLGKTDLETAVSLIKRDTRHFAKRQLTWFRREKNVIWVDKDKFCCDNEAILGFLLDKIAEQIPGIQTGR